MLEQLYSRYKEDVYRYLLSLCRDPLLAEDLLSETFLEALRSLEAFRGNSSLKTWLFGVARHVWLRQARRGGREIASDALLEGYITEGPEGRILDREAAERINELLAQRGERVRDVVSRRVEGWSFAEIAKRWRISESSARVIDFRARKWLREVLEKEGLR